MKIISLDILNNNKGYEGFLDDGVDYVKFVFHDKLKYIKRYPKKEYKDYAHFAAIIGKFDPYSFFFSKGFFVNSVSRSELDRVWEGVDQR